MMTWQTQCRRGRWYLIIRNRTPFEGGMLITTEEFGPYASRGDALWRLGGKS